MIDFSLNQPQFYIRYEFMYILSTKKKINFIETCVNAVKVIEQQVSKLNLEFNILYIYTLFLVVFVDSSSTAVLALIP